MDIPGIRLTRQLGAGPDGTSYLGVHEPTGMGVEVRRLFSACRDPQRWHALSARLKLVAGIRDPGVRRLVDSRLHGSQPYLVLEMPTSTLAELAEDGEAPGVDLALVTGTLARVLAQAHRLGIVHGALGPEAIELAPAGPRIDLTGTRTGTEPDAIQSPVREDDLAALHVLLQALRDRATGDVTALTPPPERPSTAEAFDAWRFVAEGKVGASDTKVPVSSDLDPGSVLGRFRIVRFLGEGGMGRVYLAEDLGTGGRVALKVVRPERCTPPMLHRFHREARVLERVSNPHIARFVDVNEHGGVHYLAMEYVEGPSLREALRNGPLPEERALSVAADVARALADMHAVGLVHRDVKPANILLEDQPGGGNVARLCDFGLARDVGESSEPELTEQGAILGTPTYMSPEQYYGAPADARSDVYSLGVTLFAMLAGRAPFEGDTAALARGHIEEDPPDILQIRSDLDPALARLLQRTLAKSPESRPRNGAALLGEIEALRWGGEGTELEHHPHVPEREGHDVVTYDWTWDLRSSREQLWPYVADTDRVNRAVGLPAVSFDRGPERGDADAFARFETKGVELSWREQPFEWVAPRRFGVLREYGEGPFRWMRSTVELAPGPGGGTRLRHVVEVEPRGIIGRAAAALEIGRRAAKNLDRVYRRIDEAIAGAARATDPFEDGGRRSGQQLERIEAIRSHLFAVGANAAATGALCDYLRTQPPQVLARIRPRSFARRFGLEERDVIRTFLLATEHGALLLLWDLICPSCRVAASLAETLAELRDHARCEACRADFDVDLGSSVELVFRAHPDIAPLDLRTYCIGGPAHCPHVLAQVRLRAGERMELPLELEGGSYRIRSRQLDTVWQLNVDPAAKLARWDVALSRGPCAGLPRSMAPGAQRISLLNDLDHPVLVRIERSDDDGEALTAAEATCLPGFRDLFPDEVLAPEQLVSVSRVVLLLVSDPPERGASERESFSRLLELQADVVDVSSLEGGAIVKIHRDGVMAAFVETVAATRAALALLDRRSSVRVAVHAGSMMVTNINGRLDYFGRTVQEADALLDATERGSLCLSEAVAESPAVPRLLERHAASVDVLPDGLLIQRVSCSVALGPGPNATTVARGVLTDGV